MTTIKRYPNRKLYNTETKKYITLNGIAELIRNGDDVEIIDHITEDNLTAVTLTQIIFEQEKKRGGFLPTAVLTGLVQAGGDTVNGLRRSLSVPLDLFRQVDEEIENRLQSLVNRGELAKDQGGWLRQKLLDPARWVSDDSGEETVKQYIENHNIPSRAEVDDLHAQLTAVSTKLDFILSKGTDGGEDEEQRR